MRLNNFIIPFILFFLPQISICGGTDSLLIDGVYIRIGASKSEVRAKFDSRYAVSDQSDSWAIATNAQDNARFVCSIDFQNGKVRSISKHWSDYYVESGGLKSFQVIYGLLSNLTKQGFSDANVTTAEVRQPNLAADIITLVMGNRTIEISIQNNSAISRDRIAVHVDETISK